MVINYFKTRLPKADQQAINAAVKAAEKKTKAEIIVSYTASADHYHGFKIIYGLALGTFAALCAKYHYLPGADFMQLLIIQLVITTLLSFIPLPRFFIPKHIRHEKAANLAFKEYYTVDRNTPSNLPFVLLSISAYEQYSHILVSDLVREKIKDEEWQKIIDSFTKNVKSKPRREAVIEAVNQIAAVLAPKFK